MLTDGQIRPNLASNGSENATGSRSTQSSPDVRERALRKGARDLSGKRYAKLVVQSAVYRGATPMWQCRCDCGRTVLVRAGSLANGNTRSCGCFRGEQMAAAGKAKSWKQCANCSATFFGRWMTKFCSHACSVTASTHLPPVMRGPDHPRWKGGRYNFLAEYRVWAAARDRCTNPRNKGFKHYGGRGIVFCERWIRSFDNFLADMGPRPSKKHSLDRIDNDRGYEPGNCRWTTRDVQHRNTRRNRWVEAFGERLTLTDWARRVGLDRRTVADRLNRGFPPEIALMSARTWHEKRALSRLAAAA